MRNLLFIKILLIIGILNINLEFLMQEGFSFIPENYFYSTDEDEKEEDKEEELQAKEQKEMIIQNVVNAINIITNKNSKDEEIIEEFVPGIINDRFKLFCEYRTNFQNKFFHYLGNDIIDTKRLLDNLLIDNRQTHSINYNHIELQNISYNLDYSNFEESYKKVNNILEDLLINFSSLKSLQQERIKPKFDGEEKNKELDKDIKKLIIKMMKKIRFCEALVKMEKAKKKNNTNDNNNLEEKVKNNVKLFLIKKIQNFSQEFQKNNQHFMRYLKEMGDGLQEFLINDDNINNNNITNSYNNLDDEKENLNKDFLYTQEDDLKLQIKKRDEDINILANSINELSVIFKDLQTVVHEQGTILDRIDYNIDISYDNSHRGLKHIKKAEEHHNESCFRNVILLLFTIIFIETILIIFKIF